MLSNAGLAGEVERLRPVVTRLQAVPEDGWSQPEPPALDIAAITGSATASAPSPDLTSEPVAEPQQTRSAKPRRSFSDRFGLRLPQVAAVAFSALVLLAAGTVLGMQLGDDSATQLAPTETLALSTIGDEVPADASGEVKLTGVAEGGGEKAVLDVSGLSPNADGEFYELWLLGEKGELVALGSFKVEPDGASQIEVPVPVESGRVPATSMSRSNRRTAAPTTPAARSFAV